MRRSYGREAFRALLADIHAALPEAAIGLDVIAGFPGETEAEFENTVRLIEELPVSHLHVFPFSKRPGTAAAAMPGHLPGDIKKARAERLRLLGAEKLAAFAARFVGRELEVVGRRGREGRSAQGGDPQLSGRSVCGSAGTGGAMCDGAGCSGGEAEF